MSRFLLRKENSCVTKCVETVLVSAKSKAYGRRYRKGFSGSNISSNLCMKLPYKIQARVMREIYRFD